MLSALLKSLSAITDKYFWKIIFFTSLITFSIFAIFLASLTYWLSTYDFTGGWLIGKLVEWLGPWLAMLLSYFFFPLTFPIITLLFLDSIASHVESKHYLDPGDIKVPSLWKTLPGVLKFVLVSIFLNIIILPLYLVPGLNLFIYYLLNGYLFGREYFEMIAYRYNDRKEVKAIRRKNRFKVILSGILITITYTTPFINLIAPVIATIFIVHVYHGVDRQKAIENLS